MSSKKNFLSGLVTKLLIGFKAIYIPLVGEVFVFPILQSPPDMALNFRTCQLHTAWELLHENGGNERQAAWHALPRSDPTTDDLKSRVEFAGGTTVIRVK